jgi:hypothetical protein
VTSPSNPAETFIWLPASLPPTVAKCFHPIGTTCGTPVEAHINIFNFTTNSVSYGGLVVDVVEEIKTLLRQTNLSDGTSENPPN